MADSGSGGGTIIDQVIKGLALRENSDSTDPGTSPLTLPTASGTTDSTKPTPQPQPVDRPAADMSYFPPNGQQSQGNGIPGPDPSSQAADLALPQPSSSGNLDLASVNKPPSTGLQDIINRARPHAQQLMRGKHSLPFSYPLYGFPGTHNSPFDPAARGRKDDAPNPYMDERRSHKSFSNRNRSRSPSRNDENRRGYRDRSPVSEEIVVVQTSAVGHIMGKLGRTISMIEKHTGAKIQFDDNRVEHGATRTCTVKGDSSQRAAAIREIRRAESNAQAAQDRGTGMPSTPGGRSYQGPGYMQPRLPGEEHDRIYVPTMSAGLIIGKSGDTIKTTQQTTGATIAIAEESQTLGGWRPVDITGTPPCLWAAQKAINDIVKSDTRVDWMSLPLQPGYPALATPPTGMRELVRVPNQSVGVIIGKRKSFTDAYLQSIC